jgi:hypothetical protein
MLFSDPVYASGDEFVTNWESSRVSAVELCLESNLLHKSMSMSNFLRSILF